MRPHRTPTAAGGRPGRAGTTLTEVLMALLVMGVGLVSVVTLFPISLLRSVEATKLTQATLLRQNAEAILKSLPSVVGTTIIERGIVEDPDRDGATWDQDGTKFVFDPLGAHVLAGDGVAPPIGTNPAQPDFNATGFGDFNGDGQIDTLPGNPIARYTFGIGSVAAAEDFVTLPDSFVTLADRLAGTFTYNASGPAITLLPTGSNALREYAGQTVRVTALHVDNPESVVRDGMVDAAGNGVTLASPLPAAYTNGTIGRLLIEVPERRFTWMATVRRFGVKPSVTIVVFFRRAFDPADERVYFCGEPAGSYNEFTLVPGQNGGSTPPGLKVGGWMFDLYTFRWWKIASVREANVPLAGGGTAPGLRFTVDPEEVDPSAEARGVGMPRGPVYAIFPRNVVEAYTLKKD